MQGKKIKTYSSASAAGRSTGVAVQVIARVARGGSISAGGYLWQWGSSKTESIKIIRQQRLDARRKKYGQKVTQYDFSGKRIAVFPSLQDAEAATGVHSNALRAILKGESKSGKGFYFRKGYSPEWIDLSDYKYGKAAIGAKNSKKVNQFSLKGKLLKTHSSISEAAKSAKVHLSCITLCCKGKQKTSAGFLWKYA